MPRYDQYDEVTSPPEGAELLLNDPTDTSGGTQPHGTLKRITVPDLVPPPGDGNIDGGSAGSTYSPGQAIDGGGA